MFNNLADIYSGNVKNVLKEEIKNFLQKSIDLNEEDNLIEYGIDSIQIMQISNKLRKAGIKITFSQLISNPSLREWYKMIDEKKGQEQTEKLKNEKLKESRPFLLTDIQYAYWVGRMDDQLLGGVGCHTYLEIDGKSIEPKRLQIAWSKLLVHHPMLRARFLENGTQEIMDKPYSEKIIIHDFTELNQDDVDVKLIEIRDRLSHRKLAVEMGQVIGLELSILPQNYTRIHFDVDLLVADLQSLRIILRDLAAAYAREQIPPAQINWNFGEYLMNEQQRCKQDKEEAKQYWKKRLSTLPFAPSLPLNKNPESIETPIFKRRRYFLEKEEWDLIKKYSAINQVTPAMVLLTAYSKILERWSGNSNFLINIPMFDRQTEEYNIENVVADFTNLLLFEVESDCKKTFLQQLKGMQSRFHQDVANTAYSGVNVLRDLAKLHSGERFFAPIVFACNLGSPLINEECRETFGELSYMISQTPQVWLDFQIYERNDGLVLVWDVVEELFPKGLIDEMFTACTSLIRWLARNENWNIKIDVLPKEQQKRRRDDIELILPLPESTKCLHTDFFKNANENPNKIALFDSNTNRQVSYKELSDYALRIANLLKKNNIGTNDVVAITLPRGINQIAGVLGILAVGACYVPISIEQPSKRRDKIFKKLGIKYVLSDSKSIGETHCLESTKTIDISKALDIVPLNSCVEIEPENTAYIILTSGSTGEPKGVEVSHYSAWNTVSDVNQRYIVGENDCLLSVSALDFDLSVYDIFGMLSVQGKIVLISDEARRDSSQWLECINKHNVTIWNSVPILLDMLITTAESFHKTELPLRIAILSGDWIRLELATRLESVADKCRLVAMGGATEASIWSNYFDVSLPLPCSWKSIPYGRPLKNQVYRVVDEEGRDCPDWVPGELWIGGSGVAKGYKNDEQLTGEKFISTNELRWYKTGDRGRFWPDGNIEFLGRKDYQVKIRGHRIELGEIEASIRNHPYVKEAITTILENENSNKYLVSYIVPYDNKKDTLLEENLKKYLKQLLPEYMIPAVIIILEQLPLTANGKLDRKKLSKEKVQDNHSGIDGKKIRKTTKLEQTIQQIWQQEFNQQNIEIQDNFFKLGGDSLIATRIIAKIQEKLSIKLLITNIFEFSTILELSQYIEQIDKNN